MSIFCSFGNFDEEGSRHPDDGFPQPYGYRKSHVIPSPDDPRAGSLDLGYIPGFIRRGGADDFENEDDVWPYLRMSLTGSQEEPDTIVLDVDQVTHLVEVLNTWLARVNRDLK